MCAVATWQERLFELIRVGHGFVACKGGTGTLVELAVVWEMLNKGMLQGKPFVVLGDFWTPIIERVREVEMDHGSRWSEAVGAPGARGAHPVRCGGASRAEIGAGAGVLAKRPGGQPGPG